MPVLCASKTSKTFFSLIRQKPTSDAAGRMISSFSSIWIYIYI
jgi:hypothetical protein